MSHAHESADMYRIEHRHARVAHACTACGETIGRGMGYTSIFFVQDREPGTSKQCARCRAIWLAIAGVTSEPILFDLDCEHSWRDTFGEDEPPDVAALAFMLPGDGPTARLS